MLLSSSQRGRSPRSRLLYYFVIVHTPEAMDLGRITGELHARAANGHAHHL